MILRPDAVVAVGLKAAVFARDHLPRTPMVFCNIQQPARHGLVGTWITGVSNWIPPDVELKALRAAAPNVTRVAVFFGKATGADFARGLPAAAAAAGVELIEVAISDLAELAPRARAAAARADALWLPADPTVAAPEAFRLLLQLSIEQRKPLLVFTDALVKAGALVAVRPDHSAVAERLAETVALIRAGRRAGDIPVTTTRRSRLVLNAATARALGREIPLAARAGGEVIQ